MLKSPLKYSSLLTQIGGLAILCLSAGCGISLKSGGGASHLVSRQVIPPSNQATTTEDPGVHFQSFFASNTLPGWPASNLGDHDTLTAYSSTPKYASPTNTDGTVIAAWFSQPQTINTIYIYPRVDTNNNPLAFPKSMDIYVTNEGNTAWVKMANYNESDPNSAKLPEAGTGRPLKIMLPTTGVKTFGVALVPVIYNTDGTGPNNFYFQIAEIQAQRAALTYHFRMIDYTSAIPISNASFKVYDGSSVIGTTTTDSDGYFSVQMPPREAIFGNIKLATGSAEYLTLIPQDGLTFRMIQDPDYNYMEGYSLASWNFVDVKGNPITTPFQVSVNYAANPTYNSVGLTSEKGIYYYGGAPNLVTLTTPWGSVRASGGPYNSTFVVHPETNSIAYIQLAFLAQMEPTTTPLAQWDFPRLAGVALHIRDATDPAYNTDVVTDSNGGFQFALPPGHTGTMNDDQGGSVSITNVSGIIGSGYQVFYQNPADGSLSINAYIKQ